MPSLLLSKAAAVSHPRVELHLSERHKDITSTISDLLYANLRSYRKDKCAVLGDIDLLKPLIEGGLDAELLSPDTKYHWSGIQRRAQKPWKRTIAGDYSDWFLWFMKWQRFRAFHTIILVNPLQYMLSCDFRGYIDGMLARLANRPVPKVIIIESERFGPQIQSWIEGRRIEDTDLSKGFGEQELHQAVLALLYGTWLTKPELQILVNGTIWFALYRDSALVAQTLAGLRAFTERRHHGYWHLDEDGMKLVQGLEHVPRKFDIEEEPQIEQLFRLNSRKKPVGLPDKWLESQINLVLKEREWVTVPILERLLSERHEELRKDEDYGLREVLEEFEYDTLEEQRRRLNPTRAVIRRLIEKFVQTGRLEKRLWYREIGRPTIIYSQPNALVFRSEGRCGQCVFYVSLRRRCRLWWLLNKSFSAAHPRWKKDGEHPLSLFELHKMKNAWRIGPHSSACTRFLDKKRDYRKKNFPESCDVCGEKLTAEEAELPFRRCVNCGTRYFRMKTGVKVLTGYEHEFKKNYVDIAGHEPGLDIERLAEEDADSLYRKLEREEYEARRTGTGTPENLYSRTLVLFPNDTMFVRDGKLFILKLRKVEAIPMSGTIVVDHVGISKEQRQALERGGATVKDVPKRDDAPRRDVVPNYRALYAVDRLAYQNAPIVRSFAVAMVKSAIVATRRMAALANLKGSEVDALQRDQLSLLRHLEHTERPQYLTYEALVMRRYWNCYDIALRRASARIGPRTKSRFVTDYVPNPAGRARGYSAVDAAINYLHQRRLYKSRVANTKLGLGWDSRDGFLHRKRKNSTGMGLLLDLADPFKFADREKLLEVILKFELNWRDFYMATDRQGVKFYYPRPQAVDILELVGTEADNISACYGAKPVPLAEAYELAVKSLVDDLSNNLVLSYRPFVFGDQNDFERFELGTASA